MSSPERTSSGSSHAVALGDGVVLREINADEYVREVLPHSAKLWAGARAFDTYVAEFRATAGSAWGKRRFRTYGLELNGEIVSSMKRYERTLRWNGRTYRAAGIGAVFTPEALRGRGYATALLAAFLDAERAAGTDLTYLFSDIAPAFYASLGFVPLPSRAISLRADALDGERHAIVALDERDAGAVRCAFGALEARRPFAFARTALDWEWQRLRAASRQHPAPTIRLGIRLRGARGGAEQDGALAAYVAGRRIPSSDAFVLDEFAFARDEDLALIQPLLRAAAGDLRRIAGWLPPLPGRRALPGGAVRKRTSSIAMLVPLSAAFRALWRTNAAPLLKSGDLFWSTDHI